MKVNIYSVFDVKAANYAVPFFLQRDAIAHRAFTDLVNDPRTSINKHPGDYSLFKVGIYDDNSSEITSCKPELIVQAAAVYKEPEPSSVAQPAFPGMAALTGSPVAATKEMLNGKSQ